MNLSTVGRLKSLLSGSSEPILLLGAGASVSSGIPGSNDLVSKIAKWGFCVDSSLDTQDPTVMRSDWLPWIKGKPWFDETASFADNYPSAVQHVLQPAENRKDFFSKLLNPGIPPSTGYLSLCEILHLGHIKTILTTNFDELILKAQLQKGRPHLLNGIRTNADYVKLSTSPENPQIVHLHGSIEHYTDKNILEEVEKLDDELVDRIVPLLRDHPLIVVGYRGTENSVMEHLFRSNLSRLENFKHGIFWCVRESSNSIDLSQHVQQLAAKIGANFQLVSISGFDDLITNHLLPAAQEIGHSRPSKSAQSSPSDSHDMSLNRESSIDDLDWSLLKVRIEQYCRTLLIDFPEDADDTWWLSKCEQLHLIKKEGDVHFPTVAGYLLFAGSLETLETIISVSGPQEWISRTFLDAQKEDPIANFTGTNLNSDGEISETTEIKLKGNLWKQLDQIDNILAILNRPFRLKGAVSQDIRPYPPLAIKELVVNALVHRSYKNSTELKIDITPATLTIESPGGLVETIAEMAEEENIETLIRESGGGIKGYRNPVLADIFYSAGKMDKKGSGLSDVCSWMEENAGSVSFGPNSSNEAFKVILGCRPDVVDKVTDIAPPRQVTTSRYVANFIECKSYPEIVWHAGTTLQSVRSIWEKVDGGWLPPFILNSGRIHTFFDIENSDFTFGNLIDVGDIEPLSTLELSETEDGAKKLVWLIKECLYRHFNSLGLIVDKKRARAYFPRTDDDKGEGERKITYTARVKKATRTVVKKRINPTTGKLRYWEHEAFSFVVDFHDNSWKLFINPGYVFTWDGGRGLLAPDRVNKLSTRRAARDYNNAILNDLVFWLRIVSNGTEDSTFTLRLDTDLSHEQLSLDSEEQSMYIEMSSNYPAVEVSELVSDSGSGEALSISEMMDLDSELEKLADETRRADMESRAND